MSLWTPGSWGEGESWQSRLWLAFVAVAGSWVIFSACLVIARFAFESLLEVKPLSLLCGAVALGNYLIFAAPVAALCSREIQLRYFGLLVCLSFTWSVVEFRILFSEWPWTTFREPHPSEILAVWVILFTLGALGIYLILLRRGVRPHEHGLC